MVFCKDHKVWVKDVESCASCVVEAQAKAREESSAMEKAQILERLQAERSFFQDGAKPKKPQV